MWWPTRTPLTSTARKPWLRGSERCAPASRHAPVTGFGTTAERTTSRTAWTSTHTTPRSTPSRSSNRTSKSRCRAELIRTGSVRSTGPTSIAASTAERYRRRVTSAWSAERMRRSKHDQDQVLVPQQESGRGERIPDLRRRHVHRLGLSEVRPDAGERRDLLSIREAAHRVYRYGVAPLPARRGRPHPRARPDAKGGGRAAEGAPRRVRVERLPGRKAESQPRGASPAAHLQAGSGQDPERRPAEEEQALDRSESGRSPSWFDSAIGHARNRNGRKAP